MEKAEIVELAADRVVGKCPSAAPSPRDVPGLKERNISEKLSPVDDPAASSVTLWMCIRQKPVLTHLQ